MSRLNLTSWQRQRLRRQLAETHDARVFRRTLAVLEFDHGRSAADIARMLGVTRQSVYHWVEVYTQDHDASSLEDEEGRGRHPLLDPDPEREKKTPHSPANPGSAAAQRRVGSGRVRPVAVPAVARYLGEARRSRQGLAERPQCPACDLRGDEPADGDTVVSAARQGA